MGDKKGSRKNERIKTCNWEREKANIRKELLNKIHKPTRTEDFFKGMGRGVKKG